MDKIEYLIEQHQNTLDLLARIIANKQHLPSPPSFPALPPPSSFPALPPPSYPPPPPPVSPQPSSPPSYQKRHMVYTKPICGVICQNGKPCKKVGICMWHKDKLKK